MILISKTYELITEESAENGEAADLGYIFYKNKYAWRLLVCE